MLCSVNGFADWPRRNLLDDDHLRGCLHSNWSAQLRELPPLSREEEEEEEEVNGTIDFMRDESAINVIQISLYELQRCWPIDDRPLFSSDLEIVE